MSPAGLAPNNQLVRLQQKIKYEKWTSTVILLMFRVYTADKLQ